MATGYIAQFPQGVHLVLDPPPIIMNRHEEGEMKVVHHGTFGGMVAVWYRVPAGMRVLRIPVLRREDLELLDQMLDEDKVVAVSTGAGDEFFAVLADRSMQKWAPYDGQYTDDLASAEDEAILTQTKVDLLLILVG